MVDQLLFLSLKGTLLKSMKVFQLIFNSFVLISWPTPIAPFKNIIIYERMKTHSSANCILITLVDTKYELFPSALLGIITAYMNDIVHTYGNKLGHCRYLSGTSKGTGRGSKDLFFSRKRIENVRIYFYSPDPFRPTLWTILLYPKWGAFVAGSLSLFPP